MHIHCESRDSVLIWQINRPERRNALGSIVAQELWEKTQALQITLAALHDLPHREPKQIRVLVIKALPVQSANNRVWIAGGDLKELSLLRQPREGRAYAETMAKVCQAFYNLPIPVVTLIDGLVIGAGIEFALAADLRFATTRSTFHFKQLELGLVTAYGSSQRLIQLVGVSKAMNWLLRSKILTAQEALEHGLIHESLAHTDDWEGALDGLVKHLTQLPYLAVKTQKQMLHAGGIDTEQMARELDLFQSLWMNETHQQRLKNFLGPGPVSSD